MSFAFLPLYTGDYRRDTQHLTPLRHGIYLLLLFHCWDTRGPLPLDEQEMAGIANCRSADEIDALRYVVRRFFVCMADGHYNRRMQLEIERANAISNARSNAGKRGYQAKAQAIAKQVLNNCQASATTPTTTTTTTTTSTEKREQVAIAPSALPKPKAKTATRLHEGWTLPDDWRQWAVEVFNQNPQKVVRVSLDFRDYWHAKPGRDGVKLDWLATWRRWCRKEFENA